MPVTLEQIKPGNHFEYANSTETPKQISTIIQLHGSPLSKFILGGQSRNPWHAWNMLPKSTESMLEYLNTNNYEFLPGLNTEN
jgi:hypothetical protein